MQSVSQMILNEIAPHLNKIATLYLKNNKRKVGWIFMDQPMKTSPDSMTEIYFISVQKGKRCVKALETMNRELLHPHCELIPIESIERIRSSK